MTARGGRKAPARRAGRTVPVLSVAREVVSGADVDTLLDLVTPPMPAPSGAGVAAVPDDPVQAELLRSTQVFRDVAAQILKRSVPDNTRNSYASHIRAWADWCERRQVPALPADPAEVMYFLTAYGVSFEGGQAVCDQNGNPVQAHAAASLGVRVAALARIHRNAGLPSPTEHPAVQQLMTGLRRSFGVRPRNAKGAIDLAMLQELTTLAAVGQAGHDRRWAATLLHSYTGAGVGALRGLRWPDVDLTAHTVDLPGRSGALRAVALPDAADSRLSLPEVLARVRARAPHLDAVFVTDTGVRISRQALHQTLIDARSVAGPLPGARASRLLQLHAQVVGAGAAKPLRDVALLECGWWAALRRAELSALAWGQTTLRQDEAWAVLIARSKTDQEGHGATLYLPQVPQPPAVGAGGPVACPAEAMTAWHAHICAVLGSDPKRTHPKLPVFPRVDRYGRLPADPNTWRPLSGHAINLLIQQLAARAGYEPSSAYGGHSLRAGFVTEALRDRRVTPMDVQRVTRHRSLDTLIAYRREIESFATSPVHQLITGVQLGDD